MSNLEERLVDYRALRDASKAVLFEDIEYARTAFSAKGLTNRYLGGVIEGGKDVYEVAKVHAVDNRGILAIVLGALALWFGREPLLAAMAEEIDAEEPASATDGSDTGQDSDDMAAPAPTADQSFGDKDDN
ncbi:hypothetical protein INR77_09630 [Erythrobacter sp. SCSIO 43205]|uniref:hypothetical protein n=1 Tax=Erythrobacter sp. SCSIO 43205 TaxID=2779361 RepID=UPI001CA8E054|nr:hypothetical protein [Erythrobacter sp. SCSIO 43205]UAB77093.1 hypothetical protein INR77_09630 [Erythrobacter sp. SCSIO 43205]